jgi:hypothetical protein
VAVMQHAICVCVCRCDLNQNPSTTPHASFSTGVVGLQPLNKMK